MTVTTRGIAGEPFATPAALRPRGTPRHAWRLTDFPRASPARLAGDAALGTLVIDVEEEFDWHHPVAGTQHSTAGVRRLGQLAGLFAAHGVVPTYLVTYPVLTDAEALAWLRREAEQGRCTLGVQLHPWVTPPFGEGRGRQHSFAGNLPRQLEERKLVALCDRFAAGFGFRPAIYRAGRYGLGRATPRLLEQLGFRIDTSLAPRSSFAAEGGPDFSAIDYRPFWFGEGSDLLELPLCRSIVGWGGRAAASLHDDALLPPAARRPLRSLLAGTRSAERITLSPEGNDLAAMARLARSLLARGEQVLSLSFHSSSLVPGKNPYVRSEAELRGFLDRLAAGLDMLTNGLGVRFVEINAIPSRLQPRGP